MLKRPARVHENVALWAASVIAFDLSRAASWSLLGDVMWGLAVLYLPLVIASGLWILWDRPIRTRLLWAATSSVAIALATVLSADSSAAGLGVVFGAAWGLGLLALLFIRLNSGEAGCLQLMLAAIAAWSAIVAWAFISTLVFGTGGGLMATLGYAGAISASWVLVRRLTARWLDAGSEVLESQVDSA